MAAHVGRRAGRHRVHHGIRRPVVHAGYRSRRPLAGGPSMTALPKMDVAGRAGRVRAALAGAGCEALLVTNLTNVRYLTGFTGSAGILLVLPDELLLVTDGRYDTPSREQLAAAGVQARIEIGAVAPQRKALAGAAGSIAKLGLEAGNITWAGQRSYDTEVFTAAELVPTNGVVEELRRVKDEGEIARIEEAARI